LAILFSNSMQVSTLIGHNWFNLMLIQLFNLNNAPERPSFTAPQNDPSLPFPLSHQIKNPCNLLSLKHYQLAYLSFITHIYLTLWTKRCVGKDTCKRKKRKKSKMGKKKKQKSKFNTKVFTNANQSNANPKLKAQIK
jgi:hypothetical protein